jgi:hypothetical protein
MASAIAFIQWDSYRNGVDGRGFFAADPLTFNSKQERLHLLGTDDHLWLVSRCLEDQQYYFVGMLHIAARWRNSPDSALACAFGEFAIAADRARSHDLSKKFPAESLLRAFEFDSYKPIKFGANIGQSLQTIRVLTPHDERVLETLFHRVLDGEIPLADAPFGLWTKCDAVFADYFLKNWQARRAPLAFLLYDSPPVLPLRAPVFIHSDKNLRLLASFRESQFVSGHKQTVDPTERLIERERIWVTYRESTINPPVKEDFDFFWDSQNGIRALFVIDNLIEIPRLLPFKVYGRALEWGYPIGVGYRYLTLSQSIMLLRAAELPETISDSYLSPLLG